MRVRPVQPELVGVRPPEPRIPVGRGQGGHHPRAGRDLLAVYGEGLDGYPPHQVYRGVVAEDLLHGVGGEPGLLPQQPQLVGMAQERENPAREQVHRAFVARDVEEHDLGDQFVPAEHVAVVLGGDKRADQVVAGIVPFPVGHVADDSRQLAVGRPDLGLQGRVGERLERAHQRSGELTDTGVLHHRDAQHLRDHAEGEREGEFGDEVRAARIRDPVQRLVDKRRDPRFQRVDGTSGEGLGDKAAKPRVVRRVLVEDGQPAHQPVLLAERAGVALPPRQACQVPLVDGVPGSLQFRHVLVPGQDPEAERMLVGGRGVTQFRVVGIGIVAETAGERVEDERFLGASSCRHDLAALILRMVTKAVAQSVSSALSAE